MLPNVTTSHRADQGRGGRQLLLRRQRRRLLDRVDLRHGHPHRPGQGQVRPAPGGRARSTRRAKGKAKFEFLGESGPSPSGSASFTFKKGKIAFAGDTRQDGQDQAGKQRSTHDSLTVHQQRAEAPGHDSATAWKRSWSGYAPGPTAGCEGARARGRPRLSFDRAQQARSTTRCRGKKSPRPAARSTKGKSGTVRIDVHHRTGRSDERLARAGSGHQYDARSRPAGPCWVAPRSGCRSGGTATCRGGRPTSARVRAGRRSSTGPRAPC